MIFIKRKKIIFVGVAIGLLWVLGSYLFSSHPSSESVDYKEDEGVQRRESKVIQFGDVYQSRNERHHFTSKLIHQMQTWLPADEENKKDKILGKRRKKLKKGKKHKDKINFRINDHEEVKSKNEFNVKDVFFGKSENKVSSTTKAVQLKFINQNYGENGLPYVINITSLNSSMGELHQKLYKTFGHNALASSQISVKRTLPDVRSAACKALIYPNKLPKVSVVIVFFNEAWSTLLRTIHSIILRSSPALLKEIILVDDGSTMSHLKQSLEDYINLLHKVKLQRTTARVGVVQARQMGAELSSGEVLIFLDSHCEVTAGWLEPLLNRVDQDETAVVTSVMDIIDDNDFTYRSFQYDSINIGAFTWALQFIWIGIPPRIKQKLATETDPISTPTMPGGLFTITRKYFDKLGGFDVGMNMWGAENFEMSFKIWMCGGKLETHPCSHVGHIFRKGSVYKLDNSLNDKKNFQRVAEVWMDEYKEYYYQKTKTKLGNIEDISFRQKLRQKLQCNNFEWYIKNVYPEMFLASKALISGEIQNSEKAYGDGMSFTACIDSISNSNKALSVWPCHGQGGNQFWMLSANGEIRNDEDCFDFAGVSVVLLSCHGHRGNQEWIFTYSPGEIIHKGTQLCLGLSEDLTKITMERCNQQKRQKWVWGPHQQQQDRTSFRPIVNNKINQQPVGLEEEEYYEEEIVKSEPPPAKPSAAKDNNVEYEYYEDTKI